MKLLVSKLTNDNRQLREAISLQKEGEDLTSEEEDGNNG
jgi:hypothetical protein